MLRFVRDAFWLTLLAVYLFAGVRDVPLHGDESTVIWMSHDYFYLFEQGDLDRLRYNDPPQNATEQHLRLLNPMLTRFVYGFALALNGYDIDDINEQWTWGAGWAYNVQNNAIPSDDILLTARFVSTAFTVGGMIVLFFIACNLGGAPVGYLATLYYALNPAILLNGRRAMMEGSAMFFTLLVVLAAIWLLKHRNWLSVVVLGVATGAAVASKHPAVFTVIPVFAVCGGFAVYYSLRDDHDEADEDEFSPPTIGPSDPYTLLTLIIVAALLSLVVFFALNPVWWDSPLDRFTDVLDARTDLLDTQIGLFGGYADFGDQLAGFLRQVFAVPPQYYEAPQWGEFIAAPIHLYAQTPWTGISFGAFDGLLLVFLLLTGVWNLFADYSIRRDVRWVIGVWALVVMLAALLLTPLEWQRYYIGAMPPLGVIAALGLWRWVEVGLRLARQRLDTGKFAFSS